MLQKTPGYQRGVGSDLQDYQTVKLARKLQYDAVEGAGGPGYQKARQSMRDLKTFEDDLDRAAWTEARQNEKKLLDWANIPIMGSTIKSVLTKNPKALAADAAMYGLKSYYKYLNSPNRAVKQLFKNADEAVQKSMAEDPIRAKTPVGQWENAPVPTGPALTGQPNPPIQGGSEPLKRDLGIKPGDFEPGQYVGTPPGKKNIEVVGARPDFTKKQEPVEDPERPPLVATRPGPLKTTVREREVPDPVKRTMRLISEAKKKKAAAKAKENVEKWREIGGEDED
jgi:hypothetical protein